jgi:hypothetical protein
MIHFSGQAATAMPGNNAEPSRRPPGGCSPFKKNAFCYLISRNLLVRPCPTAMRS